MAYIFYSGDKYKYRSTQNAICINHLRVTLIGDNNTCTSISLHAQLVPKGLFMNTEPVW